MSEGVTSAGSCLAVSATLAASPKGVTEYEALTWTDSNEVVTMGDFGAETEVITFSTVCDGQINKRMGPTNYGQQSVELAHDADNAAQVIIQAASDNRTKLAVRVTLGGSGDVAYYEAYVASARVMVGGASDYQRLSANMEIDSPIVYDIAV